MPQGKSKLKTGCTTPKRLLGMVGNGWAVTRRKPKRRAKGAEGGKRRGEMNQLETRFLCEVLSPLEMAGDIAEYRFEGVKLRLAEGAWYTPDFVVKHHDGHLEFVEVKGFWREAARVRIKVAAEQYAWLGRFVVVQRKNGQWQFEQIGRGSTYE
jgi:hypothetical protein